MKELLSVVEWARSDPVGKIMGQQFFFNETEATHPKAWGMEVIRPGRKKMDKV